MSSIQELQKKGKPVKDALYKAYEDSANLANLAMSAAGAAQSRARADYGPSRRLLPLTTACYVTVPISESLSKGGSTTSTPKTYLYSICPFSNVSQIEVLPDEWVRAEDVAKGQLPDVDRAGEVSVGADGGQAVSGKRSQLPNRTLAAPYTLGNWHGWVPHSSLLSHFTAGLSTAAGLPAREAADALVGLSLPRGSDGTDAALYYEGLDTCYSESMKARRRTWVLLTCTDALMQATGKGETPGGLRDGPRPPFTGPAYADWAVSEGFARDTGSSGWANATLAGCNSTDSDCGETAGSAVPLADLPGPSLTQRLLQAMHPDVPARFLPRRLNGLPMGQDWEWLEDELPLDDDLLFAGTGPGPAGSGAGQAVGPSAVASTARVLHVAEDGLCNYVVWLGTKAACSRRLARSLKAAADAQRKLG